VKKCVRGQLPKGNARADYFKALPAETLEALAEFIEYSDAIDVTIVESTIRWIQIHDSRLRSIVEQNGFLGTQVVPEIALQARIIDAAVIYAGMAAVFEYARGQKSTLPLTLNWEDVRKALANMNLSVDIDYSALEPLLDQRKKNSPTGPFEQLNIRLV
jgi:hypothetical protein